MSKEETLRNMEAKNERMRLELEGHMAGSSFKTWYGSIESRAKKIMPGMSKEEGNSPPYGGQE